MLFVLGIIAGLVVATLIVAALAYFKGPIEQATRTATTALGNAGPRQTGSVFVPMDEDELAREEIIRENKEKGLDTPIADLR